MISENFEANIKPVKMPVATSHLRFFVCCSQRSNAYKAKNAIAAGTKSVIAKRECANKFGSKTYSASAKTPAQAPTRSDAQRKINAPNNQLMKMPGSRA